MDWNVLNEFYRFGLLFLLRCHHCLLLFHSIRHQIAFFKTMERLHHPYRAALSQQYSVACFATVSSELSSLARAPLFVLQRCMVHLEVCNFVTTTIIIFKIGTVVF
jgi:hypothetical protein